MKRTEPREENRATAPEASRGTVYGTQAGEFGRAGWRSRTVALWGGVGLAALLIVGAPARDLDPQLIAKWPGFSRQGATAVALAGDYAYVAAGTLQIFDVRNPASPQPVGGFPNLNYVRDVALLDQYAYVAAESAGLYVIDLNDPAATPMPVHQNDWPGGGPETVVLSDELA